MPIRPKYGSPALKADRADRERRAALEESGRDPFAEALQSMIPINQATQAAREHGRLGGLASLAGSTILGRGGVGAAPWLTAMARRIGGGKSTDDLIQAAHEAVLKEGGTLDPRKAMRASKSAMLNARSAGGQGARTQTARALAKAQARVGDRAGELRLWTETNKHLSKPITLERFRKVRSQIREPMASLDVQLDPESGQTLADLVRGVESPESRAILRQGVQRLTPQQQTNLLKKLRGEDVNPAILQRLKRKLAGDPPKISGGSGGAVLNPFHPDFRATVLSDPRVAAALERSSTTQGFSSIPEEMWPKGSLGVTGARGLGLEEAGAPVLDALLAGPAGARVLQAINPGFSSLPKLGRHTRLHEALHALVYGKQAAAGQEMTGVMDPKHAFLIALRRAQQGHRPPEAIAEDFPHRAIDAMAWNIQRKNPR